MRAAERAVFVSWVGLQGGHDYSSAVPLPVGRTLRLNHYQFKDSYDYFFLDLKAGQTLTLSLAAGSKGIRVGGDGTFVETDRPYAGLQLRDARGGLLGEMDIAGRPNDQRSLEVDVSSPQRFYLLVGSRDEGTHKDQFVFRADVKDNFDADSGRDAGSTPASAVPLDPRRRFYENFLTRSDAADYFRLAVSPGQKIRVEIVPENPMTRLLASFYDGAAQELDRSRSQKPGGSVRLEADANAAMIYLRVYRDVGDEPTRYAILFPEELPPLVKATIRPQLDYRPKFLRSSP